MYIRLTKKDIKRLDLAQEGELVPISTYLLKAVASGDCSKCVLGTKGGSNCVRLNCNYEFILIDIERGS